MHPKMRSFFAIFAIVVASLPNDLAKVEALGATTSDKMLDGIGYDTLRMKDRCTSIALGLVAKYFLISKY